jgi:DNA-binding XRE family transcriptional regulator
VLPFCDLSFKGKSRLPAKYPKELKTIADHLCKNRFDLKLSQPQMAKMIGVSTDTITYWENGRFVPKVMFAPKIIEFLGYNPYQIDTETLGGRVKLYRHLNGLSQKKFAKIMRVDPSTIKSFDENELKPESGNFIRLKRFLEGMN